MIRILKTANIPTLLIRLAVGLIFLSEGIQKYLYPDLLGTGRFEKIGFAHPSFWACFTGTFEIFCGILILLGLLTRLAVIPLLIIMLVAFITTKYPLLVDKGFWAMSHDYRTDFAMTLLLIYLLIYGGGNYSIDEKLSYSKNRKMKYGNPQNENFSGSKKKLY
jgi:uncharacterized membrane protein YphA (DoxX/SURF4 family)